MSIQALRQINFYNPNLWEFYFSQNPTQSIKVQSITLPFTSFETEQDSVGRTYVTSVEFNNEFTFDIIADELWDSFSFLRRYQERYFDFNSYQFNSVPLDNAVLVLQKFPNIYSILRRYGIRVNNLPPIYFKGFIFENVIIKSISEIPFTYGTTDKLMHTVTCSCDKVEVDFFGALINIGGEILNNVIQDLTKLDAFQDKINSFTNIL